MLTYIPVYYLDRRNGHPDTLNLSVEIIENNVRAVLKRDLKSRFINFLGSKFF